MDDLEKQLSNFHIEKRSALKDKVTYFIDIDVSRPDEKIAILCSNKSIQIYDKCSMGLIREYNDHPGLLSKVKFCHVNSHILYSSCSDGTVKSWDTRVSGTNATQVFRGYNSNVFISLDISSNDFVVCAGTEKVEEDSFLVFWDARYTPEKNTTKDPLGVYAESHNDDITQVRFHPKNPSIVASGSTDGLVNVFDISKDNEDDALNATCNSDSSVSYVGWAGQNYDQVFCLTHDEGFCWWDLAQMDSEEPITLSKTQDIREKFSIASIDYVIGGEYHKNVDALFLVGGSHTGNVSMLTCSNKDIKHLKTLYGGHSSTVRAFYWNVEDDYLLTGGEDAQLLFWKSKAKEPSEKQTSMKMASSVHQRVRVHSSKSYRNK